jgi:hypothetical protein
MAHAKTVVSLAPYQGGQSYYLFCRDCGFETETDLPSTMPLYRVRCPGCMKCGFMIGNPILQKNA